MSYLRNAADAERGDHLPDPDLQFDRCHMLLNGGARVPAFAAAMSLTASAQSIELMLLAQGGALPDVQDGPSGLETTPGGRWCSTSWSPRGARMASS